MRSIQVFCEHDVDSFKIEVESSSKTAKVIIIHGWNGVNLKATVVLTSLMFPRLRRAERLVMGGWG
jgi:hypothetical protein